MTMNPFPPQAYTRDTMVKAYQWLLSQNANIRELASTPDLLVSLYLKAQLQGNECLDRPSIQNFKTELKSLAGMMGEFETAPAAEALAEASLSRMGDRTVTAVQAPPQAAPPPPSASAATSQPTSWSGAYSRQQSHSPHVAAVARSADSQTAAARTVETHAPRASAEPSRAPAWTAAPIQPASERSVATFDLDPRSLQMIHEVKAQMNLSSDIEALRAMISIGYTKFKRFSEHS